MAVALQSKARVRSRLIAGNAGSNPAKSTYVRLSCLLCVVCVKVSAMSWSLVQGSPTGFGCLIVCGLETSTMRRPRPEVGL